jgi:hypothetical protein
MIKKAIKQLKVLIRFIEDFLTIDPDDPMDVIYEGINKVLAELEKEDGMANKIYNVIATAKNEAGIEYPYVVARSDKDAEKFAKMILKHTNPRVKYTIEVKEERGA